MYLSIGIIIGFILGAYFVACYYRYGLAKYMTTMDLNQAHFDLQNHGWKFILYGKGSYIRKK